VCAIQVAYLSTVASVAYFNLDDLHNFAIVRKTGLSWHFLNQDLLGGHWAPGGHVLIWLVNAVSPLNWTLAFAILELFALISLVFMDRILRAVDTLGPLRIVLLAAFAFSPFILRPATWFASGVQALPGLAFTLVCLDGFLRYRSTRQTRYWAECVIGFAAGLLFWEFPLFLIGGLPILVLVLETSRLNVRTAILRLRELWPIWTALLSLSALYIWNYETYIAAPPLSPTTRVWLDFMWVTWSHAFVPASFGLVLPARPIWNVTITVLATELAIGGLVFFTVRRDRRAWRAWLLFAAVFLANAGLVGWDRAGFPVPHIIDIIGTDLRYQTGVFPFLLLAVALAIRDRPAESGGSPAALPWGRRQVRRARRVSRPAYLGLMALVALCIYVPLAVRSGSWLADNSPGVDPKQSTFGNLVEAVKPYLSHVRSDLDRLHHRSTRVALYDAPLPIVWGALYPYDLASRIVPQVTGGVAFDGANQPRYLINAFTGHVYSARFHVQSIAALGGAGAMTGQLAQAPRCAATAHAATSLDAPVNPPLDPGYFVGRLHLSPAGASRIRIFVVAGNREYDIRNPPGYPDGSRGYITVPGGTTTYVFGFAVERRMEGIRVVVQSGGSLLCLEGIDFGSPVPR